MSDTYVRFSDGLDTDNGTTWALAKKTLAGAAAIAAAGEYVYVSSTSEETNAAATSVTFTATGTVNNPIKLVSVSDSSEPPTTLTPGAIVSVTVNAALSITGYLYIEGITFKSAGSISIGTAGNGNIQANNCILETTNTGSSGTFILGGSGNIGIWHRYNNLSLKFANAANGVLAITGNVSINGGSILPSVTGSAIFGFAGDRTYANLTVDNFDFSSASSTVNLIRVSAVAPVTAVIKNSRLPTSWSGSLVSATPNPGARYSMYNCWGSAINYSLWIETYSGNIRDNVTITKSGGASDGTTPISWKMAATANANEFVAPLISDDMAVWIDSVGTSKTITVDIIHDSTTALKDNEVWLDVSFLGSSSYPLGTPSSDKRATIFASAVDQATSSATWTTTGLTNPNKQKLEVTFTPNMKGFVYARVCLAKPSYTIYVDPKPVIS